MSEALRRPPASAPASQTAVFREGKCPWSGGVCSPAVSTSSLEKDLEPARDLLSSATMQAHMVRSVPSSQPSVLAAQTAAPQAALPSVVQIRTVLFRQTHANADRARPPVEASRAYPASKAKSTKCPDPHVVMACD